MGSDKVNPVLYSAFLVLEAGGGGVCLLRPSCHQFKRMEPNSIHLPGGSPGLTGGREGDGGEKVVISRWPEEGKRGVLKRADGMGREGVLLVRLPWGRQRGPPRSGGA